MLFEVIPAVADLALQDMDSGVAGSLLRTLAHDYVEYETRLQALKGSLEQSLHQQMIQQQSDLASLNETLQLEASRAEEEAIRMRAMRSYNGATSFVQEPGDSSTASVALSDVPAVGPGSSSKLTDFWKQKYSELQREIDVAMQKRDYITGKLDSFRASQSSTTARTTRSIAQLNESIVSHKRMAQKYIALLQQLSTGKKAADATGTDGSDASPTRGYTNDDDALFIDAKLGKEEEEGLQRVLEVSAKEGEVLHRMASFLTKREHALKYKLQKMQQKIESSSSGAESALEDVLFLRAEMRTLKEQLENQRVKGSEADFVRDEAKRHEEHERTLASTGDTLASLRRDLEVLNRKVREVRVSIIRAEHKSQDGYLIVKKAVDEQRVRTLRERLAFVEQEKLHVLADTHRVALETHFDAVLLAKTPQVAN